jgi:predicted NUDIX family NTP pyrophosphohydrolase
MPKESAGLLMYRRRNGELEFLLVHPGGPFWKNKDAGAWTIPKGEIEENESPLAAAQREFREELGFEAGGTFLELKPVRQKAGKLVRAWAFEGDCDPARIHSQTFVLEWPPRSGRETAFPEVDQAGFFTFAAAQTKLNPAQLGFLAELKTHLEQARE